MKDMKTSKLSKAQLKAIRINASNAKPASWELILIDSIKAVVLFVIPMLLISLLAQ